jgi:hypothetical protein
VIQVRERAVGPGGARAVNGARDLQAWLSRWRRMRSTTLGSVMEGDDLHLGAAATEKRVDLASPRRHGGRPTVARPRNDSWAELMRRVFATDVLECPRCLGSRPAFTTTTDRPCPHRTS